MKRIAIVVAVGAVFLFSTVSMAAEYWASSKSNKYHYSTCVWAQKIKPSNLVKFGSPEEAKKAGYVPCKVCSPPTATGAMISEGVNIVKSDTEAERSGCCSHHDGVCGCENGRAVCCDGTLSPACGCD